MDKVCVYRIGRLYVRSFVIAGRDPAYCGPPALRPLCWSNAPAQGQEGNW